MSFARINVITEEFEGNTVKELFFTSHSEKDTNMCNHIKRFKAVLELTFAFCVSRSF